MVILDIQLAHFHPLLVHLPIGTIILSFGLEVYTRFRPNRAYQELISFALGFTAISALASLGTGWLMGEDGGFDEELLFLHRWMAVAFTTITILLFILKRSRTISLNKLYMPFFIIALILIGITGHLGGSMTHGENYLFTDTSVKKNSIKDVSQADVHAAIIQPIFDNKCVSCHNSSKIKGGLLLIGQSQILKGGDSGSLFDTVQDKSSLLLHRLQLPNQDEEHMPPKGKLQLTTDEIALIRWWVANNNCFDCKTKDLETTEKLDKILANLQEDDSPRALLAEKVEAVPQQELHTLRQKGISIYPLSESNPLLVANLFGEKINLDKKLQLLEEYAENIVELNLANSPFNDTIAKLIRPFENLTKLQLQNTLITDESLKLLEEFALLESLNLYNTSITDKVFKVASNMPALRSLYLWQSKVSNSALQKFQTIRPAVSVEHIPSDAFKDNTLSPPSILAETSFFKESVEVQLETIFEDSQIFYTSNGTIPDSTSAKYNTPFTITESATINAIVVKEGWLPSQLSTQSFKKSSFDFKNILLNKAPNKKYEGQKGKTLIDLKRGSTNFADGNWLGYQGSHFSATLELAEKENISTVSIGALSAPSSWIFYPSGFIVYTSNDGKVFRKVKSTIVQPEKPNTDTAQTFFDLEIPPTSSKFVKVEIKSILKNPEWHAVPGGDSWVFIDEIILN